MITSLKKAACGFCIEGIETLPSKKSKSCRPVLLISKLVSVNQLSGNERREVAVHPAISDVSSMILEIRCRLVEVRMYAVRY